MLHVLIRLFVAPKAGFFSLLLDQRVVRFDSDGPAEVTSLSFFFFFFFCLPF